MLPLSSWVTRKIRNVSEHQLPHIQTGTAPAGWVNGENEVMHERAERRARLPGRPPGKRAAIPMWHRLARGEDLAGGGRGRQCCKRWNGPYLPSPPSFLSLSGFSWALWKPRPTWPSWSQSEYLLRGLEVGPCLGCFLRVFRVVQRSQHQATGIP